VKERAMVTHRNDWIQVLLVLAGLAALMSQVLAIEPEGARVTYVSNSTKNSTTPDPRNDSKGTITVVTISAIQQDFKWKAYVGNVSGTLVLKDSADYSIYEWPGINNPTGIVYISRDSTVTWSTVRCANSTTILAEQEYLNHTVTASDNLNHTFSDTKHKSLLVGSVAVANSTCQSVKTWVNDSAQTDTEASLFQEVLLDDTSSIIYATIMEQNAQSYRNDTITTYDFQALVADSALPGVEGQTTYYFYVEISG
jgi:hypothetical protein